MELCSYAGDQVVYDNIDPSNAIYINLTGIVEVIHSAGAMSLSHGLVAATINRALLSRNSSTVATPIGSHAESPPPSSPVTSDAEATNSPSTMSPRKARMGSTFDMMSSIGSFVNKRSSGVRKQTGSSSTIGPGHTFGERCLESDRKTRGESAYVQEGGMIVRIYRSRLLAAMSEVSDSLLQDKFDAIKAALRLGEELTHEQVNKIQQLFTEHRIEAGTVVGKQGKPIDTMYIIHSGSCIAKLEATMVCATAKGAKATRPTMDVPSIEPLKETRKSVVVSTCGPHECVGLTDYYVGAGKWTVTVRRHVDPLAPQCTMLSSIKLLPT